MFDEIKRLCFDAGYSSALNEWLGEIQGLPMTENEAKALTLKVLSKRSQAWEMFTNPVRQPDLVRSGRREFAVIEGGKNDENSI